MTAVPLEPLMLDLPGYGYVLVTVVLVWFLLFWQGWKTAGLRCCALDARTRRTWGAAVALCAALTVCALAHVRWKVNDRKIGVSEVSALPIYVYTHMCTCACACACACTCTCTYT